MIVIIIIIVVAIVAAIVAVATVDIVVIFAVVAEKGLQYSWGQIGIRTSALILGNHGVLWYVKSI